jgi:iron complex transport system permease protein
MMQALFQNPLADPYIVGASAGAGMGAVFMIWLGLAGYSLLGLNGLALSGFVGALCVTWLVCFISGQRIGGAHIAAAGASSGLLLTGMAVSGLCGAVTTYLLLKAPNVEFRSVLGWLMGSLAYRGWIYPFMLTPYVMLGLAFAWHLRRQLDLLSVGDDIAHHLGVNVAGLRAMLLATATLMAAATVSACGIIGFIGLLVPHVARMVVGPMHRTLIPACAIGGASLLLAADLGARSLSVSEEVPVGVITAVIGSAFFLWLLRVEKLRAMGG